MTNKIGGVTETAESEHLELEALNFCLECIDQRIKDIESGNTPIK